MTRSLWRILSRGAEPPFGGAATGEQFVTTCVRLVTAMERHRGKLVPLAILGLCAFAYWQPHPPAWRWAIAAAVAFAVLVFVRAYARRKTVFRQPLSATVTAFVVSEIIGPIVVVIVGLAALISGNEAWFGAAQVIAIVFAVLSLL